MEKEKYYKSGKIVSSKGRDKSDNILSSFTEKTGSTGGNPDKKSADENVAHKNQ